MNLARPTTKRIIVIERPARLRLEKLQLCVGIDGEPERTVPVEDIGVLVLDHAQTALTVPLLAYLAEQEVAVVVCNAKHLPVAAFLPFAAHHQHALIARKQAEAGEPTKKRIWQQIVVAKISAQADALEKVGVDGSKVRALAKRVRSGDADNVEGLAAVRYFPLMFGEGFLRDTEQPGTNGMLNYGYALIRAAVARAVCGAGLYPAFGVHHHNRYDPYALADDLMEPLRPIVDLRVKAFLAVSEVGDRLGPPEKRWMHPVLTVSCRFDDKRYPVLTALELYAAMVRRALLGEARRVVCPTDFAWED